MVAASSGGQGSWLVVAISCGSSALPSSAELLTKALNLFHPFKQALSSLSGENCVVTIAMCANNRIKTSEFKSSSIIKLAMWLKLKLWSLSTK